MGRLSDAISWSTLERLRGRGGGFGGAMGPGRPSGCHSSCFIFWRFCFLGGGVENFDLCSCGKGPLLATAPQISRSLGPCQERHGELALSLWRGAAGLHVRKNAPGSPWESQNKKAQRGSDSARDLNRQSRQLQESSQTNRHTAALAQQKLSKTCEGCLCASHALHCSTSSTLMHSTMPQALA